MELKFLIVGRPHWPSHNKDASKKLGSIAYACKIKVIVGIVFEMVLLDLVCAPRAFARW